MNTNHDNYVYLRYGQHCADTSFFHVFCLLIVKTDKD